MEFSAVACLLDYERYVMLNSLSRFCLFVLKWLETWIDNFSGLLIIEQEWGSILLICYTFPFYIATKYWFRDVKECDLQIGATVLRYWI
jgi:hypothetical protein